MKRILTVFGIALLAILLVACNRGKNDNLLGVDERDKVELSATEAVNKIAGMDLTFETVRFNQSLEFEFESEIEGVQTEANGKTSFTLNLDKDANLIINTDVEGKMSMSAGTDSIAYELDAAANFYYVAANEEAYLDFSGSFKEGGTTATLSGKYNQALEMPEGLPEMLEMFLNIELEQEMVDEILATPEFLSVFEELDGLTFYEGKDYFAVKFNLTKEMLAEYEEMFADENVEIALEDIKELNFEFMIKFTNNRLSQVATVCALEVDNSQVKMKVNFEATISFGLEMPAFPAFTGYARKDFEDILDELPIPGM